MSLDLSINDENELLDNDHLREIKRANISMVDSKENKLGQSDKILPSRINSLKYPTTNN